jgi:DNA methylase.
VALNNKVEGCKPKDMIGIPWMLAFALRDTGWYLRNDIIWMKDNPMPESVKDRCARCYEHIFLFSKSKKYFFDYKAISEPIATATAERLKRGMKGGNKYGKPVPGQPQPQSINRPREHGEIKDCDINPLRNKRDVWKINTVPSRAVTMPPTLQSWLKPVFSPVVQKVALCLTRSWEAAQPAWLPHRWGVISSASS